MCIGTSELLAEVWQDAGTSVGRLVDVVLAELEEETCTSAR